MARADEELRSEQLQKALELALEGSGDRLVALLARHGGLPGPKPNARLGAALGESIAAADPGRALKLSLRLAAHDADADAADAFLPVAGAFALCALARRAEAKEPRGLDEALFSLAADGRSSVRIGTTLALAANAARDGGADSLVRRAEGWLFADARDERYGAAATALDALSEPHSLAEVGDRAAVLAYLDGAIREIVEAPRAAERSPQRRRLLAALRDAMAAVGIAYPEAEPWLRARCAEATHEDLRSALAGALDRMRPKVSRATLATMHDALASSAKPPRDPSRTNEGARGRGRKRRRK